MIHELEVAVEAARTAESIHRAGRHEELQVDSKSTAIDLVTQVDRESEAAVGSLLRSAFPDDGILGEEEGEKTGTSGRRWIVDPLDGTLNYTHGFPYYAVSIALEIDGRIDLGVVLDTARSELFTATRGGGAWLEGQPLAVTSRDRLAVSMLATGFAYTDDRMRHNLELFARALPRTRALRRPGAAALDLCSVAAGRFDGFWELWLGPWDVAAGSLIVEEAGGRVTNASGDGFAITGEMVVATNGLVHDELLGLLAGH